MKFLNFVSFNKTVTNIFQFFKHYVTVPIQFLSRKLLQVFRKYLLVKMSQMFYEISAMEIFFSKVLDLKEDSIARTPSGDFFCSFKTYTRIYQLTENYDFLQPHPNSWHCGALQVNSLAY